MLLDPDLNVPPYLKVSSVRVGIDDREGMLRWLAQGYGASMSYLSKEERLRKVNDTSLLLRDSKSVMVFLLNYRRANGSRSGYGRIATYAGFRDYHDFFKKMIDCFMIENGLFSREFRSYVDTGPVLERGLAFKSGLGWIGRNSMLINPSFGSFTFLGTAVSDERLDSSFIPSPGSCGSCTKCIDSCPTGAINPDRTVDSNLCISYHTIENRGVIPRHISERMGDMVFGCDICNEVCPWNREIKGSTFEPVRESQYFNRLKLEEIAFIESEAFNRTYKESAIRRSTFSGFARNAVVALFNEGRTDIVKEVSKMFDDIRKDQALLLLNEDQHQ